MREILFRGKRIDTGNWTHGYYTNTKWYIKGYIHAIIPEDCYFYSRGEISDWYAIEPDTVGQYTGMKDKNGVKIFEGDIISFRRTNALGYINDRIGEVRYFDQLPMFYILATTGDGWSWGECEDIIVIGNIYDNPELLHEQQVFDICRSTNLKCTKCNPGPCDNRKEACQW